MIDPTLAPNLLVVMADQLRRDALGIYGDPDVATPNLDALAGRGVRFTQACATSPICVPFRFSFMTGAYAHTRQVPAIEWRMSPCERTWAHDLTDRGYRTAYVGKWHLYGGHGGAPWSSPRAVNRTPIPPRYRDGWQLWRAFELRNDPFDTCIFVDDDPTPRPLTGYQTDALTDIAIDTLAELGNDRPYACVVSVEPPHPPYLVLEEDLARWRDRDVTLPPNVPRTDAAWLERIRNERRRYAAATENLDRNVGRLLHHVRRHEAGAGGRPTIVVFLSDHGELGGSHGLTEKQYPYEPSIGIPLIVADPRTPHVHGTTLDVPVHTEDIAPTLLALARPDADGPPEQAGVANASQVHDTPAETGGADLTALLRGTASELARPGIPLQFVRELRPGHPFHDGGWRGFRTGRYKATWRASPEGVHPWQTFDLHDDPFERHDRRGDPELAGVRRDLLEALRAWQARHDDDFVIGDAP